MPTGGMHVGICPSKQYCNVLGQVFSDAVTTGNHFQSRYLSPD